MEGYRVELPEERLTALFDDDSKYVLTPDIVGPTNTTTSGIIGEQANIDVEHLKNVRSSTLLYELDHAPAVQQVALPR